MVHGASFKKSATVAKHSGGDCLAKSADPVLEGQVWDALRLQEKRVEQLTNSVSRLYLRLMPAIVNMRGSGGEAVADEGEWAPLASRLFDVALQLQRLDNDIESLLSSLEI